MAFMRKVTSKGRQYWVLVHAVRKGGKVIQKSRYIGKTLPPKAVLEKLKQEFLRSLSGSRYRYLSREEVEDTERKKEAYKKEIQALSSAERQDALKEFMIRFTYDSTKLSGVPITLRQTFLILEKKVVPKGMKNLRGLDELQNHKRGFGVITTYRGVFNLRYIRKLHKTLFAGIDDSIAGKTRYELKRNVKVAGTPYLPLKWHELEKELALFFKWYKAEGRKLHPLELAALVHLKLISLQPFVDGNSRLSRLLMNWILWKRGYPLIDIPVEDLESYYNALDAYQIEKNEWPFVAYIKRKFLNA